MPDGASKGMSHDPWASVVRNDKLPGALRLTDMRVLKLMLATVLVGVVGVDLLVDVGSAQLAVKPTVLGGNIPGGLVFGLGWGVTGLLCSDRCRRLR